MDKNIECDFYNRIYDILIDFAGANPEERFSFVCSHLPEYNSYGPCDEWRFCGKLGFGGKYRRKTNSIDYYNEDYSIVRQNIVEETNAELKALEKSFNIEIIY